MELSLPEPALAPPQISDDCCWFPWRDDLLETHAAVKAASFAGEMDTEVFPSLGSLEGCRQLMRAIRLRPGFEPRATWLIFADNHPVATIQCVRERTGWGAIQNVGVIPSYRNRGLGRAIVLKALHSLSETGACGSYLEVTAENHSAIQLYRSIGFRCRKTVYKTAEDRTSYVIAESAISS